MTSNTQDFLQNIIVAAMILIIGSFTVCYIASKTHDSSVWEDCVELPYTESPQVDKLMIINRCKSLLGEEK